MKFVALENLRSLYNVGAILRTCEFFGIPKVILIGYSGIDRSDPELVHRRIRKTSCGTIDKIETEHFEKIEEMKEKYPNFRIVGIENNVESTIPINNWQCESDCIIVLGNEVDGLSKTALDLCDDIVEIPRIGTHSSLNVTTACGIILNRICSN